MDDILLETTDLTKRFRDKTVVDRLSLCVRRGDIYGFLGPNGAGKSITIRMITGLVRPSGGSVSLMGSDISTHRQALECVGALVETPSFYKYLTARENLRILGTMSGSIDNSTIDRTLQTVGLSDFSERKVGTFSHGMKQRLGIGQAILSAPEFLILDEPMNGLDPQGMKDVRDLLLRLSTEVGVTVFLSSHLLHEVEQVCTRVGIINHGRLVAEGSVKELLTSESEIVYVHIDPNAKSVEILRRLHGVHLISEPEEVVPGYLKVALRVTGIEPSKLNRLLIESGVEVSAIYPKARTLESLFLDIVGNLDDC